MSDRKWGFFPFEAMDYKAAQAYLDKKAQQGWVLDKLYCKRFARFVPAEGRYHYVDLDFPRIKGEEPDSDYIQLCDDAGWDLVADVRNMLVFRSQSGKRPLPLQTDAEMEAEQFWKKHVRRNWLITLITLLALLPLTALLFSIPNRSISITELLCSNAALLGIPYLLFAAASLLWTLYRTAAIYIRFRRTREIATQKHSSAWVIGLLSSLMSILLIVWYILYLAEGVALGKTVDVAWSHFSDEYTATPELCQSYPVITAADLNLEYSDDSRYLDGRRALLAERLEYSEIAPGEGGAHHILTTERYECASETIANWLFSARKNETAYGAGFIWGELNWSLTTSGYGFDQICFARDCSYLLLQKGTTVALVGASNLDLTEYFDILQQRLFPE